VSTELNSEDTEFTSADSATDDNGGGADEADENSRFSTTRIPGWDTSPPPPSLYEGGCELWSGFTSFKPPTNTYYDASQGQGNNEIGAMHGKSAHAAAAAGPKVSCRTCVVRACFALKPNSAPSNKATSLTLPPPPPFHWVGDQQGNAGGKCNTFSNDLYIGPFKAEAGGGMDSNGRPFTTPAMEGAWTPNPNGKGHETTTTMPAPQVSACPKEKNVTVVIETVAVVFGSIFIEVDCDTDSILFPMLSMVRASRCFGLVWVSA
jgi:hypothetical protein